MKYFNEICIYCHKTRQREWPDALPFPHNDLYTRGLPIFPIKWNCWLFKEHTFVNEQDYLEGRISIDGKTIKIR